MLIEGADLGDLLALDPGLRTAGVALFRGGVLVHAASVELDLAGEHAGRCLRMAQEVVAWVGSVKAKPRTLVLEWPQVYAQSRVDPNTLLPLIGVSMAVAGYLAMLATAHSYALQVVSVLPREWTGQLPKSKSKSKESPRAIRVWSRLSPAEMETATPSTEHDKVDAIGLGLYALGRFEPRRVYARGG